MRPTRRALLFATGPGLLALTHRAAATPPEKRGEEEVSPLEDLMREHGLLNRILLIYDECIRRLDAKAEPPRAAIESAAHIIQRFIEGYHEKLEEEHLFPRFEHAGKLVELVRVLRAQHEAGRKVTAAILKQPGTAELLRQFVRMYRPHEAREDTVLFPAFHALVTPKEYDRLGEAFEEREHQLFGKDGFEKMVDEVARLEETLGIGDLARFTPR
jgi:hemerythrin-like domain-containing protein